MLGFANAQNHSKGEGYFGLRRGKDLVIQLAMTDLDVINKFCGIVRCGTRKERLLPSGKIAYFCSVTNQGAAAGLMMTVLPLMGERRSEKIRHCLASFENTKMIREGKYTKRRCVKCAALRQQKYRAKRLAA
jgi:hypothetical protein